MLVFKMGDPRHHWVHKRCIKGNEKTLVFLN